MADGGTVLKNSRKPTLAISALALGAVAAPAHAQSPLTNWTGAYAGLQVGASSTDANWDGVDDDFGGPVGVHATLDSPNLIGGAVVGYDQQFGAYVVGIEADYTFLNFEESAHLDGAEGVDIRTTMHGYGTVRARTGYAFGPVLCYATGGFAYASINHHWDDLGSNDAGEEKITSTVGWAAGAGVEYALSDSLSVRAEGLYVAFPEEKGTLSGAGETDTFDVDTSIALGQIALTYRF